MNKVIYTLIFIFGLVIETNAQTDLVSTGTGSAYDIAYPAAFSYSTGITITFRAHVACNANPTLNINGLGALTIKKNVSTNLVFGDIVLNQYVTVIYDGTNFQLTSPVSGGATTAWTLGGNAVTTHTNFGTTNAYDLPFTTNGIERMRLISTGGLALGSNNALGGILNVNGDQVIFGNNPTGIFYTSTSAIEYGFSQQVYDASSGATGSPTMRYVFSPRNNFDTGTSYFGELTFGKTANQNYGYIAFSTRDAANSYAERVRIDAEGNVGIGTVNPTSLLDIYKNSTTIAGNWKGANIYHTATISTTDGIGLDSYAGVYGGGGTGGVFTGLKGTAEFGEVNFGVYGKALYANTAAYGVYGTATSPVGFNYGVYGLASGGTKNWAGYFEGDGYFSDNLGIGTNSPLAKLEVVGNVKITDGTEAAGRVLTSDVNGYATWQAPTGALPAGLSGQTMRHDGTNWVANSILFNDGTNVGVGLSSPTAKFHLYGISNSPTLASISTASTSLGTQRFSFSTGDVFDIGFQSAPQYAAWMQAGYNGTAEAILLNPLGGNVGIGTANPTEKLEINSSTGTDSKIHLLNTSTGNAGIEIRTASAGTSEYIDFTNSSTSNVGAGLPDYKNRIISDNSKFQIQTSLAGNPFVIDNATNYVGIGTFSPSEMLDVAGSLRLTYAFMPGGNAGINGQFLRSQGAGNPPLWITGGLLSGGTTNYIPKWSSATSLSSTSLLYDNGANVGIGTASPGFRLDVRSAGGTVVNIDGAAGTDVWTYYGQAGTFTGAMGIRNGGVMTFFNGGDRMVILSGGNVGIGTTTPTKRLDISGDLGIKEFNFTSPGTTYNAFNTSGYSFVHLVCTFNTVINGIAGGTDGKVLVLYVNNSATAGGLFLNNQNAGAIATDRIDTVNGANITVNAGAKAVINLIYSANESRWIVTSIR